MLMFLAVKYPVILWLELQIFKFQITMDGENKYYKCTLLFGDVSCLL